jgi:hypothetical protein
VEPPDRLFDDCRTIADVTVTGRYAIRCAIGVGRWVGERGRPAVRHLWLPSAARISREAESACAGTASRIADAIGEHADRRVGEFADRKNASKPEPSFGEVTSTPRISRWPSAFTPTATATISPAIRFYRRPSTQRSSPGTKRCGHLMLGIEPENKDDLRSRELVISYMVSKDGPTITSRYSS